MGFKCGIVGLPNVGKSTLFNMMTNLQVPAENFPFCTIKPNIGIIPVIDQRLKEISSFLLSKKIIYTNINFFDIAGLVKGASTGSGLGNSFLENIKQCNAILHMVRCFNNDNITHIYHNIDPERDIDIINMELLLSDLSVCEKYLIKTRIINRKLENVKKGINLINFCICNLKAGIPLREVILSKSDHFFLEDFKLLTLKPMMYILNADIHKDSKVMVTKILSKFKDKNVTILPLIIKNNIPINSQSINFLQKKTYDLDNISNINFYDIIREGYKLLKLITFFTAGPKETRAWTLKQGATIKKASGLIHTDFEKGFIRAQVISYHDFIDFKGNMRHIKLAGKMRIEGKKYIVQDGDIVNFLFNV
ncbi:GTP-binding protein [Buchnera aphidicola (Cinara tujafilina)]|uniref:GTP-binding protein n=1 Tax=Buchnera aphidicola (Cinara tujafilina) TaxID=261317 RepID=F7WZ63_9GAMM|nr:redox-regulated ATPase YchF [Buchnera aphidicola]AEH39717.1 GTP-binding protein [Buchnera aphidicola (Cinara tujafilina)]